MVRYLLLLLFPLFLFSCKPETTQQCKSKIEAAKKNGYIEGYADKTAEKPNIIQQNKITERRIRLLRFLGGASLLILLTINGTAIAFILSKTKDSLQMANHLGIVLGVIFGLLFNLLDLAFIANIDVSSLGMKILLALGGSLGTFSFFWLLTFFSSSDGAWPTVTTTAILTTISVVMISVLLLDYKVLILNSQFSQLILPFMAIGGILYCIHFFIQIHRQTNDSH